MVSSKSAAEKQILTGWVALPNGAHATQSRAIIDQILKTILKEHIFFTLLQEGYQSSKTALYDFTDKTLHIDKPADWPGTSAPLRVLFKDREQLWNQFTVRVQSAEGDTLITGYPQKLLRLQRRASYRVETPRGSTAMFLFKGSIQRNFYVQDLSAEGAQFFAVPGLSALDAGDAITDIALTLPGVGKEPSAYINIRQARVMRIFENEQGDICYGIQFELTHNEEEILLQYVRQRERELLRKGIFG